MQDYVIMTDSTTDLNPQMVGELEVEVLPLHFNMDGKIYGDYSDGKDMKLEEFYKRLRRGEMSVTSQINPEDFMKAFKVHLDEGRNILYIAFSSALSGTYASAVIAANEIKSRYPDRKIIIVDSLCASLGEGLLVYLAVKEKRKGLSIEQLEEWINNKKLNICHWFTVDDLHHLHRGGRVSATSAFLGSMLNIKPILHVDNSGKLIFVSKCRGRKNSIDILLDKMEKTGLNLGEQTIFISHGDCRLETEKMANIIKEKFKVRDVIFSMIGPVVGTHSGPGTIALFFVGTER